MGEESNFKIFDFSSLSRQRKVDRIRVDDDETECVCLRGISSGISSSHWSGVFRE